MARERHLKNAPIVEAIIDFRTSLPQGFNPDKFLDLDSKLVGTYPEHEPRKMIMGSFGIEKGKPITKPLEDKGIQGYIYKSADGKNIAQFRVDGFTFSRLHPYTEWESVLSEARRLWELYSLISSPEVVNRLAVRYINRLDLPLPLNNFADYLTAPPALPESLPQEISQFLTRIVIHEKDLIANIIQTLVESPKKDHIGIILDIDVFKVFVNMAKEEDIWPTFESLRVLKNRIFFESITEKTARMYE